MTPFLQFRVWLRRGPRAERVGAALAAVLAVGLLAWATVPLSDEGSSSLEVGFGSSPASEAATGSAPAARPSSAEGDSAPAAAPDAAAAPSPAVGGAAESAGGASPTSAPNPCSGLRATDQGVSATEVLVAVPFISLGGEAGNSTFGLRSASDTVKIADAITAGINSEGGVACRKLRVLKYEVNPINPVDQQQKCQQIIDAKPFAVLDSGAYLSPASRQCFLDAKIPFQGGGNVTEAQGAAAYPYLYTYWASIDRSVRNWVLEEAARGSFAAQKGFQKLGLLLTECYPDVNRQLLDHLRKVGVGDAQISVFTLSGCQSISPPAELSAAVAQHRSAGASHVYLAGNAANSPQYVRQADGIGWKPTYMTSDYGQETSVTVAPNWPDGFDGAIAITSVRAGERNSGIVAPWVTRCNEWLKRADPKLMSQKEEDQTPLGMCDVQRLFAFAANGVGPNLVRPALAEGLAKAGRFEGAINTITAVFGPRKVTGGDYIRAVQWRRDCKCWKVVDREPKPGH